MAVYEVVVGNIGTVYRGDSFPLADGAFLTYVRKSKNNEGRAAGETVILFKDGEPIREKVGTVEDEW